MSDTGAVIRSGSAPGLCPASARAAVNKRDYLNSWRYWDGSEWIGGNIYVVCDANVQC